MKVLIAEDDALIREGLAEILEKEGYQVVQAADGEQALALFDSEAPQFVCLDIMMPGRSGYDVCRILRQRDEQLPIIFISAKSEEIDKVLGLELGADDFILKPFGVREVVARIRAVTRRYLAGRSPASDGVTATDTDSAGGFQMDDLRIQPDALRAYRNAGTDAQSYDLSLRDIAILRCLHDHVGKVVSRQTLFDQCWGRDYLPSSRSLDQHISQLRKRIERDPSEPRIIRTAHGSGYRYEAG
jgi:DNA-binding response OmpR family regulator